MWYALNRGQPKALKAKTKRAMLAVIDPAGRMEIKKRFAGAYVVGFKRKPMGALVSKWYLFSSKQEAIADGWSWAF